MMPNIGAAGVETAKVPFKCHRSNKNHTHYDNIIRLLQDSSIKSELRDIENIIVLVAFNFIPPKVSPRTKDSGILINIQLFRNSYSLTRGWNNSNKSTVVSITTKFVLNCENRRKN